LRQGITFDATSGVSGGVINTNIAIVRRVARGAFAQTGALPENSVDNSLRHKKTTPHGVASSWQLR
jgi:hypothetical protein